MRRTFRINVTIKVDLASIVKAVAAIIYLLM